MSVLFAWPLLFRYVPYSPFENPLELPLKFMPGTQEFTATRTNRVIANGY